MGKIFSVSLKQTKAQYNGSYQKIVEKYVVNTKDLNFDANMTTLHLIQDQIKFVDSQIDRRERSSLLSAIFISYVKKLEAKEINYKIANSLAELYRMAITDWILYDFNDKAEYSILLQEFINRLNGRLEEKETVETGKKTWNVRFNPKFSAGKKPKTLINLFPGELYCNRIIGHLIDAEDFLYYNDLADLVGCPKSVITTKIAKVINKKYPNLILRKKDSHKEYFELKLNRKLLEEVCSKNVA